MLEDVGSPGCHLDLRLSPLPEAAGVRPQIFVTLNLVSHSLEMRGKSDDAEGQEVVILISDLKRRKVKVLVADGVYRSIQVEMCLKYLNV